MLVSVLAACMPVVQTEAETEHGSDSGSEWDSAEITGDSPFPPPVEGYSSCAPTVHRGTVPRSQVASSLAATLCIAQEECCPDARPSPSCRHSMNMGFEELDARAEELGLAYDDVCTGIQRAIVGGLGCEGMSPQDTSLGACSIYYGDGEEGDPCEAIGTLGSTCAQEFSCAAGSCVDPCSAAPQDRPYVYGYACVSGEVPAGYECRAPPSVGDACDGVCEEGSYCAGPDASCAPGCLGRCVPDEPLGSPCAVDGDCREAVCIERTCSVGQPKGAPCAPGCGLGLSCDAELGICQHTPSVCRSTAG